MIVICLLLVASVAIGTVKLVTTPDEVLGSGFQGISETEFPR